MTHHPKTKAGAIAYWKGHRFGNYRENQCVYSVHEGGRSVSFRQCQQKPGFGPEGLYCKRHAKKLEKIGEIKMKTALAKAQKKPNNQELLGVLWVLLNATTEYNGDAKKIVEVMNMIQAACPAACRMWRKSFEIRVGSKVIYSWRNSE